MRRFPLKATLLLGAAGLAYSLYALGNPDVLWHIVHDQCVPHMQQSGTPAPCAEVDLGQGEQRGAIVLKDIKGVLQYLLIPTARVTGIEDGAVLQPDVPDYWGEAWRARSYMSSRRGSEVPREAVSLTINSLGGRSQNQLHIHISCVQAQVRDQLATQQSAIGRDWSALAGGLHGHPYQVRRIDRADLAGALPFKLLADGVPGAREHMGEYTLAAVATRFADGKEGFYLLAGKTDKAAGIEGSAEDDVQDHACAVLN
jgi:CDP-diacylglycerol pyrophosphatase